MEIERLDEADAVAVDREQADDQGVAPPETRDQQAYRAEYRATVEAAYTWDAAALELRQAWEAHETKWPSPEDADRDGDRSLNPEANAEVERGCGQIREIAENIITPAMRAIESEDPDRHLIGLEHCLKGTERLKEKVATALEEQPNLTPRHALSAVPDAIRFTLSYSDERYVAGVAGALERLTACGFELAKPLKNSWEGDQYKGINTQWREPATAQLFEVQFHTQASYEAKQLSHSAYERIRNPQTSDAELPELEDFQRKVCAKILIPPGAKDIAYLPRKDRDG
ncbi:MAG: hypothetical protein WAN00_13015 [Trebonia sp.]